MVNGGYLRGPSHSRGGVPIEAEGGEFIVKKEAVTPETKPLLEAINRSGDVPMRKFKHGGYNSRRLGMKGGMMNQLGGAVESLGRAGGRTLGRLGQALRSPFSRKSGEALTSRFNRGPKYRGGGHVRPSYQGGGYVSPRKYQEGGTVSESSWTPKSSWSKEQHAAADAAGMSPYQSYDPLPFK